MNQRKTVNGNIKYVKFGDIINATYLIDKIAKKELNGRENL